MRSLQNGSNNSNPEHAKQPVQNVYLEIEGNKLGLLQKHAEAQIVSEEDMSEKGQRS